MGTINAILDQLRLLNAKPDALINMFNIGIPLIRAGYSREQILNALSYV